MRRWWWMGTLILTNLFSGCRANLPARTEDEQACDRAVVALAVGHRRSVPVLQATPQEYEPGSDEKSDTPKPVVTVYLQSGEGCPPCHKFESWWATQSSADREKLPCTFRREQNQIPGWVNGFPTFHWEDAHGKSWYCTGWEGIDNFLLRFQASLGAARSQHHGRVQQHNPMAPAGSDQSLNAGDWTRLMSGMLQSGEIALNSQYALSIPAAETLRWSRVATQGELRFDAPFPLLRLNWHGVRYDDTVQKLTVSPGKVSLVLATFGEIAFTVRSP